jgi:hypothetical protein
LQFPEILADILADLADIFADLADILAEFVDTLSDFADFADLPVITCVYQQSSTRPVS